MGIVPCTRSNCDFCQLGYYKRETEAKSPTGATLLELNKRFHCNSKFILYLVTCPVCSKQYVGKAENCLARMNNHKKDVRNRQEKTLYCDKHFKNCILIKKTVNLETLSSSAYVSSTLKILQRDILWNKHTCTSKFKPDLNK